MCPEMLLTMRRICVTASRDSGGVQSGFVQPWRGLANQAIPLDDGAGQFCLQRGSNGPHDVGGIRSLLNAPLDTGDGPSATFWERRTHALLVSLVGSRHMKVDELRRGIEVKHVTISGVHHNQTFEHKST